MLYTKKSTPISPSNFGRTGLVRAMSSAYEAAAQKRAEASITAANFEITYYSRLHAGETCTCTANRQDDLLDPSGNMAPDRMKQLLNSVGSSITSGTTKRRAFLDDYSYPNDPSKDNLVDDSDPIDDTDVNNDDHKVIESDDDDEHDFIEGDDELDDEELTYNAYNSSAVNCGVCNRTSFIGGFNRFGGARLVYAAPHFIRYNDMDGCTVNRDTAPWTIYALGDGWAQARCPIALIKNPIALRTMRVLNNHDELIRGSDYTLAIQAENGLVTDITYKNSLLAHCDGLYHILVVNFKGTFTHFELEFQTDVMPLLVDLSNPSKVADSESLNNYADITAIFPPKVMNVSRGDLFFDRSTKQGWIITTSDAIRSAINPHGFTATAQILKRDYDDFTVKNPYSFV